MEQANGAPRHPPSLAQPQHSAGMGGGQLGAGISHLRVGKRQQDLCAALSGQEVGAQEQGGGGGASGGGREGGRPGGRRVQGMVLVWGEKAAAWVRCGAAHTDTPAPLSQAGGPHATAGPVDAALHQPAHSVAMLTRWVACWFPLLIHC